MNGFYFHYVVNLLQGFRMLFFFFFWVLARLFHLSLDLAHVKQAEGETEISNCSSAVVFFMVSEDKENELLLNLLWVWKTLYFSLFFFESFLHYLCLFPTIAVWEDRIPAAQWEPNGSRCAQRGSQASLLRRSAARGAERAAPGEGLGSADPLSPDEPSSTLRRPWAGAGRAPVVSAFKGKILLSFSWEQPCVFLLVNNSP